MHTQFESRHAEANELLSKARDHLAVGDASSALHTLVQALQRLDISPQAQQAAVCQCALRTYLACAGLVWENLALSMPRRQSYCSPTLKGLH